MEIQGALSGLLRELAFIQKYLSGKKIYIYLSGTNYVLRSPFIAEQNLLFLAFGTKDFITEPKLCSCPGLWAESCLTGLSPSVFLAL